LGKYIVNFCTKGGTIVNQADGTTLTRPGGTFMSCLEYIFDNDTIHTIVPAVAPQCGAYADKFLTNDDVCYRELITKSAGVYMEDIDKMITERTASGKIPVTSLYEYVTMDELSEVYQDFDKYTAGKFEKEKLIPFMMEFVPKAYGVPFWFILTDTQTDFGL